MFPCCRRWQNWLHKHTYTHKRCCRVSRLFFQKDKQQKCLCVSVCVCTGTSISHTVSNKSIALSTLYPLVCLSYKHTTHTHTVFRTSMHKLVFEDDKIAFLCVVFCLCYMLKLHSFLCICPISSLLQNKRGVHTIHVCVYVYICVVFCVRRETESTKATIKLSTNVCVR